MPRTLVFAAVTAAVLAVAVALRANDRPYIAYALNDRVTAFDGLKHKAESGDGFAAFLVAESYRRGTGAPLDSEAAATWYLTAGKLGELRAITPYVSPIMLNEPTPAQCEAAIRSLDMAGRAGEPNALLALGRAYQTGRCTEIDLVKSAGCFVGAARLDRRLGDIRDLALDRLPSETARSVQAIPATFDLKARNAQAQFLAAVPILQTGTSISTVR